MSMQVTLSLSNELYEQATRWAMLTQQDLSRTLTDALTVALSPLPSEPQAHEMISSLSDARVIELSKAKMSPSHGRRLSDLLEKQREGLLTDVERPDLLALMQGYNHLWILQSEALAEAVRRGLRKPLEP